MTEPAVPKHVAAFLLESIDSVVQLEVLLRLQAEPDRPWTPTEIARELMVDPAWVTDQLDYLCARGLLECDRGLQTRYRYHPGTPDLRATVTDLALIYTQRRVTVISLVYSRPVDPIQRLADAFKIRRDPDRKEPPHG